MKFAAGLTLTGIVGFIITEALKLLVPTLAVWIMALLVLAVKVVLVGLTIMVAVVVLGIGIFLYKRANKVEVEA